MGHDYYLDFPKKNQSLNTISLYIQGWIASDAPIDEIFFLADDDLKTALKVYQRPDVKSFFPHRFVVGFKYLLFPEEIIKLPTNTTIYFLTGGEQGEIAIDKTIVDLAKIEAEKTIEHIRSVKREKLQKIRPYLACPFCSQEVTGGENNLFCNNCQMHFPFTETFYNFLTPDLKKCFSITDTDNVSSGGYDNVIDQFVHALKDGLILDCGAGNKSFFLPNVINYEIVAYPSTDVLGVCEKLPFKNDTFDAVISIAVLEHVVDPFKCASEIVRVLKPGGRLLCQAPFMIPYHGYPHHYYNMTDEGLINLFNGLIVESCSVPLHGHPIFALSSLLNIWCSGLPPKDLAHFKNIRVGDLLNPGETYLCETFASNLPQQSQKLIGAINFLIATKPFPYSH
jgi:SAM-dependent methyltransferase